MAPKSVDYSLYLVTDSTPAILGDKDLVAVVKAAVEGGMPREALLSSPNPTLYSRAIQESQ